MSGAPVEIERKFLVAHLPGDDLIPVPIRQGYLTQAADSVEIRLRQRGDDYFMTLKSDGALLRQEYDVPISAQQFAQLWPATEGRRIEKTRHCGTLASGEVYELDIFEAVLAPLMLVEVEFPSVEHAHAFTPPDWFGTEVTEDKRFKNKALAQALAMPQI